MKDRPDACLKIIEILGDKSVFHIVVDTKSAAEMILASEPRLEVGEMARRLDDMLEDIVDLVRKELEQGGREALLVSYDWIRIECVKPITYVPT